MQAETDDHNPVLKKTVGMRITTSSPSMLPTSKPNAQLDMDEPLTISPEIVVYANQTDTSNHSHISDVIS